MVIYTKQMEVYFLGNIIDHSQVFSGAALCSSVRGSSLCPDSSYPETLHGFQQFLQENL
jgi:hypothetical protein